MEDINAKINNFKEYSFFSVLRLFLCEAYATTYNQEAVEILK